MSAVLAEPPRPPGKVGIRERNKVERRARIVRAAGAVFREKGFAEATTREIAERAEVGAGTLFLYARDKRELLIMIVNDEFDALNERAVATIPTRASLVTQLVHYFAPQLRFWAADVELARLATAEMHAALSKPRDERFEAQRLHDRRQETFASLVRIIERWQRHDARARAFDVELAAHLVLDIHIGENRKWLSQDKPTYRAGVERLRTVLAFALDGLTQSPSGRAVAQRKGNVHG